MLFTFFPCLKNRITNQRGQGLVEYLVIVALMGVATIAIVRTMGQVVSTKFASVSNALQGQTIKKGTVEIDENTYRRKDLGNFIDGAGKSGKSKD